jgi:hypothetical protein
MAIFLAGDKPERGKQRHGNKVTVETTFFFPTPTGGSRLRDGLGIFHWRLRLA